MQKIIQSIMMALLMIVGSAAEAIDWQAKWIWTNQDGPANGWTAFRKTVSLDSVPQKVTAALAVDTKYWLWINGELVVFEGGMLRGSSMATPAARADDVLPPSNTYYDEMDLTQYFQEGENTIAVLGWFWGRSGSKGHHINSGKAGFLFQADIDGRLIKSDRTWRVRAHPAYDPAAAPGNDRVAAWSIKYDARKDLNDWSANAWYQPGYNDAAWSNATEKGEVPAGPWNRLEKNELPQLKDWGLSHCENFPPSKFPFVSDGTTLRCELDFNKNVTAFLDVETTAGKTIHIESNHSRSAIEAQYLTKNGRQKFEAYSWFNAEAIMIKIPAGVTVHDLQYRWTGVGTMIGEFEASDPFYERLWWMGRNTLYICARETFMDTPDRERGLWIGDVADQAAYLFYTLDQPGRDLLKKAIKQTLAFSDPDTGVIAGLGPGRFRELPAQSLQFIDQGIWQYYFNTGDIDTLTFAYPYVLRYLKLWKLQNNNLIVYRQSSNSGWTWVDWGPNGEEGIDKTAIHNAWYYAGLLGGRKMALALGRTEDLPFFDMRLADIKTAFNQQYWQNGFYSSNPSLYKDDRINAMAIVFGLASPDKYADIVNNVLKPVEMASPHMEWIVEDALAITGRYELALQRMKNRYKAQVDDASKSTLAEKFPSGGTSNHAWNASNYILSRYVAGIAPTAVAWSEFEILPNLVHMNRVKHKVPSVRGLIEVEHVQGSDDYQLTLSSPADTIATVGVPKHKFPIARVTVNGVLVWQQGQFLGGIPGLQWVGEDNEHIKFSVAPGDYQLRADRDVTQGPAKGPLPADFTFAVNESQEVVVSSPVDIAFGADGVFQFLYRQTENVACHRDVFGDPVPGVRKKCYTRPARNNQVPQITIIDPPLGQANQIVLEEGYADFSVHLQAEDMDAGDAITKVIMTVDGQQHSRIDDQAPYIFGQQNTEFENELLGLAVGEYQLAFSAHDTQGGVGETSLSLKVTPKPVPNSPSSVEFAEPKQAQYVEGASISVVEINADDSDGSISSVSLFINDNPVSELSAPPYRWVNLPQLTSLAEGEINLVAVVMDDDGAATQARFTINVAGREPETRAGRVAPSLVCLLLLLACYRRFPRVLTLE